MSNRYGLPEAEVDRVRMRDTLCVYCHKRMFTPNPGVPRGDWATIEHLNHLPPRNNPKTIAICCGSCNSSRGRRTVLAWFASAYCTERNISPATVAKPVFDYIREFEGCSGLGKQSPKSETVRLHNRSHAFPLDSPSGTGFEEKRWGSAM